MKNKLGKTLLFVIATTGLVSCRVSPSTESSSGDHNSSQQEEDFDMKLIEDSKSSTIVKDYSYMYHLDGLKDTTKDRLAFFSDNYQMMIDVRTAKLLGLRSTNVEEMVNPSNLNLVETSFEAEVNGNTYQITNIGEGRIIDSGRYVNRYDNVKLKFNGLDANNYFGRVEYVANRDFVAFNYEMYSLSSFQFTLITTFTLSGYSLSKIDDRNILATGSNGDGFIFAKQSVDDNIDLTINDNKLIIKKRITDYSAKTFRGLGIMIIPYYQESTACYDRFLANEKANIVASAVDGGNLTINYEPTEGIHYIEHNSIGCWPTTNIYDNISFKIQNNSATPARPIICFMKTTNVSITGVSPMIVDSGTYEPTGEQVQISKNWHAHSANDSDYNYASADSPYRYYEGPWLHAYTRINVKNGKEESRNYLLAYGRWGNAFASSHAQLCLIGWGGHQVWDQSALGSWGESVTYDPDIGLGRSMIDDVRPF